MAKQAVSDAAPGPAGHIKWLKDVADHDYAAAEAFLSLMLDSAATAETVEKMRKASVTTRRANDILRATGLDPAPMDDPGVMKDLIKVIEGKQLSPVLVMNQGGRARIADGFHRVSLVYRIDPYEGVPLKLV
jgi:hypothetical protein